MMSMLHLFPVVLFYGICTIIIHVRSVWIEYQQIFMLSCTCTSNQVYCYGYNWNFVRHQDNPLTINAFDLSALIN